MKMIQEVVVTPEMAKEFLKNNTKNFRKLDKSRVTLYAKAMLLGQWEDNGQTISFASDGSLMDGQHRLSAVVQSNVPIKFIIVTGLSCKGEAIDRGKKRDNGAYLAHLGFRNSTELSAACKLCVSHEKGFWAVTAKHQHHIMDHEIIDFANEHGERMQSMRHMAVGITGIPTASVLSLAYIATGYTANSDDVAWFLNSLKHGTLLDSDMPVLHVKNRLVKQASSAAKFSPYAARMIATIGWNKTRLNEKCKVLQFKLSEEDRLTRMPSQVLVARDVLLPHPRSVSVNSVNLTTS